MKRQERRSEEGGQQWLDMMCEILKGGALAGAAAILALGLCAVLVSVGVLPTTAVEGSAVAVCVLGAAVGGTCAVRRIRAYPLLAGLGVGCVLFLLLLTAGMLVYDGVDIERGGITIACACLCGGAVPGILGRKPKKKRRR